MFRTFGPLTLGGLLFAGCAGTGDLDKVDDVPDDSENIYVPDDSDTYRDTYEEPPLNNNGSGSGNGNGKGNGSGKGSGSGSSGGTHTGAFPFPPGGSGFIPPGGSGFVPPGGSGFVPPGGSGFIPPGGSGFSTLPFFPDSGDTDTDAFSSAQLPQPLPPLGSQPEALFAFP